MKRLSCRLIGTMLLALVPAAAVAQQTTPVPRIGYVYPAGARQGSELEVVVGGEFLDAVSEVRFSGPSVKATVLEHTKPLNAQQATLLKDQLDELLDRRAAATGMGRLRPSTRPTTAPAAPATKPTWTAADDKMVAEIRAKLMAFVPRNLITPAISETVKLRLTVAPDAPLGVCELRAITPLGATNPLSLIVGDLPETAREPARVVRQGDGGGAPGVRVAATEMAVTLPVVANGQIMPGRADRYRFKAAKGQHFVAAVSARSLIPYLADAVPGWFQATLGLYDSRGKELAYADDYRFNPDPVLLCQIPEDGEYVVEIKDSLYRGREDFVYRIAMGELPFVTSAFPLGARVGMPTSIELTGWNLPMTRAERTIQQAGVTQLRVGNGATSSNSVAFAGDTLPEVLEREPNDRSETAQAVTLPVIINGRIDHPGDVDVYHFEGHAGQQVVAEVLARRLGSPLDSTLVLTDAAGKQIAANDDHEDKGMGLMTHHADSLLTVALPASGDYYLSLRDAQQQGGTEYGYRLRLSAPRPDFELRVAPSSLSVRSGTSTALTVYALRRDGFAGEITLSLKDAPAGFTLAGGRIAGDQDQVRLTLSAPASRMGQQEPFSPHLDGRAVVEGREVIHAAVPADDMMQAFAYHQLVPSQQMLAVVIGRWMPRAAMTVVDSGLVKIPVGGTAHIRVAGAMTTAAGEVKFELNDPPAGLAISSVTPRAGGAEIVVSCDATRAKPGLTGNLIFGAYTERMPPAGQAKAANAKRRIPLGALPAVPFEVVGK